MASAKLSKPHLPSHWLPRRLFYAVVVLCLCLAASALFTYLTLSRLRIQHLENRGHAIASALDAQARGPGRRNNPEFWQSLLETHYETYADSTAFLELVDGSGTVLAHAGEASAADKASGRSKGGAVHVFEENLLRPRNQRAEAGSHVSGWRIRIGLYTADAGFIRRQALIQLGVSAAAILALVALSFLLWRTFNRFLEMKAREADEAGLKALGTMAAALAHEIRNPLGAMKGLTQLAQEDLPADNPAQARLRTVVSEAERLERLVSDLLNFARRKEPEISEFDLAAVITEVEAMVQPRFKEKSVTLDVSKVSAPLTIRSDPAGLRQVLLNVLINAADASPDGGIVALGIRQDADRRSIILEIDDGGPGLGDRDPEELFRPFVTTKARGTGLGLAVSRRIMESLGGSLSLENRPQGGARCIIRLPLQTSSNRERERPRQTPDFS